MSFLAAASLSRCIRSGRTPVRWVGIGLLLLVTCNLLFGAIQLATKMERPPLSIRLRDLAKALPGGQLQLYPEPVRTFMDFRWVYPGERRMVSWFGPAHLDTIDAFLTQGKNVFADYSLMNMPARAFDGYFSLEHFTQDKVDSKTADLVGLWTRYRARPFLAEDPADGLVYYGLSPPHATDEAAPPSYSGEHLGDNTVLHVSIRDAGGRRLLGVVICIDILLPEYRFSPLNVWALDPLIRLEYFWSGKRDTFSCGRTGQDGTVALVLPTAALPYVHVRAFADQYSSIADQRYPFLTAGEIVLQSAPVAGGPTSSAADSSGVSVMAYPPSNSSLPPRPPTLLKRYLVPESLQTYRLEAEHALLFHGEVISDPKAHGEHAIRISYDVPGRMPVWGPYIPLPQGHFQAVFRMRYEVASRWHPYDADRPITVLNVFQPGGSVEHWNTIKATSPREEPGYREFPMDFQSDGTAVWEFRLIERNPRAIVYLDSVDIIPLDQP